MQFNNYIKFKKVFFLPDITLGDNNIEALKRKITNTHALKVKEAGAKTIKLNYYIIGVPILFGFYQI